MEEIKFKPSSKNNKFLLIIGIILIITIIFSIIGIILVIVNIILIINKKFYTFKIKGNELEINYKFISKSVKTYRIDQITSVKLTQRWSQKWFNLGSISFGIFGKNSFIPQNSGRQQQQQIISNVIFDIEEYKTVFNNLCEKLNITENKVLYEDKPIPRPQRFWKNIFLVLTLITYLIPVLIYSFSDRVDYLILFGIICGIMGTIFLVVFIAEIVDIKKIKSTKYSIKESSIDKYYNYTFSMEYHKIPIKKITNTAVHKNVISWKFFKVGGVKIHTGGDLDPYLGNLEKFDEFHKNLSNRIRNKKITQNADINDLNNVKNSQEINKSLKPTYVTKPGKSFFYTTLFWSTIILVPISIILVNLKLLIVGLSIFILYIIVIFMKYLLWKNTKYEFYEDRIVDISGVINISTKEIRFVNIKYIALNRNFLFDRIFNQGTINLYTAGTGFLDNKINSLKEYEQVYKEFKEVIREEN